VLLICLVVNICICGTAFAEDTSEGYVWVIPPQYDAASDFSEGLAAVRIGDWKKGKWGFIDKAGREVVPPQYNDWWSYEDGALAFRDGLARVAIGDWETGMCGFIDKTGKEVVPCMYGEARLFSEGLAAVQVCDGTGKWGFIDKTGSEVIPPQYDKVYDFSDGLAMVMIADREDEKYWNTRKWGFIDKTGKEVVPVIYDEVGEFREGRACVVQDGKLGFIDETGAIVIPLSYESPYPSHQAWYRDIMPYFSEGLAPIWDGDAYSGKYGYIDRDGNVVIPFVYDYAAQFSEGLAYVSKGGTFLIDVAVEFDDTAEDRKFGFIDRDGEVVIPLAYDCDYSSGSYAIFEQYFYDGLARVSKGTPWHMEYGIIDKTGAVTVPLQFDWIWRYGWDWNFSDGLVLVGFSNDEFYHTGVWSSCGLVNGKTGKEIASVGLYDGIEPYSEGFARVRHGEAYAWEWHGEVMYSYERLGSGKHGFIDSTGKEVVSCIFDDARSFSEGLAAVQIDGKWGYIAITE